jgi:hypothetical protein
VAITMGDCFRDTNTLANGHIRVWLPNKIGSQKNRRDSKAI